MDVVTHKQQKSETFHVSDYWRLEGPGIGCFSPKFFWAFLSLGFHRKDRLIEKAQNNFGEKQVRRPDPPDDPQALPDPQP